MNGQTNAKAFVAECSRRGITLSLAPSSTSGEPPKIRYKASGEIPGAVLETLKKHKPQIVAELERCPVLHSAETQTVVTYPLPAVPVAVDEPLDAGLADGVEPDVLLWKSGITDAEYTAALRDMKTKATACALPIATVRLSPGESITDPNQFVALCVARAASLKASLIHLDPCGSVYASDVAELQKISRQLDKIACWLDNVYRLEGK